ncbi:endonuclease [Bacillus sp. B15-48]|nr:endonuclease/exonuclease/phosphatase family protein [Bacillus sp. B15-48]MBM4763460.1 endonuclease [Bacillus sp. B15-48]
MTYNIHHGKGLDKKVDLSRIAEVISTSKADIIGLNEVDKQFSKRSHFIDQIHFLASKLNFYFAFSPSLTVKSREADMIRQYGNGILSRFPILKSQPYLLNFLPQIIEGRSILETTITVNGKVLNVYVTHLSLNPFLHKRQSELIINHIKNPAIILGDWNMKPYTRKWKRVVKRYNDVWHEAGEGRGFTYPSNNPRMRLDYIFTSKEFKILNAEISNDMPIASDHLPLVTTLTI